MKSRTITAPAAIFASVMLLATCGERPTSTAPDVTDAESHSDPAVMQGASFDLAASGACGDTFVEVEDTNGDVSGGVALCGPVDEGWHSATAGFSPFGPFGKSGVFKHHRSYTGPDGTTYTPVWKSGSRWEGIRWGRGSYRVNCTSRICDFTLDGQKPGVHDVWVRYWVEVTAPQPSVEITGPSMVQVGTTGTWQATVTHGTPPFSYQWLINGISISGADDSSYSRKVVQGDNDFTLTVKVTDDDGRKASDDHEVGVQDGELMSPGRRND